MSSSRTDLVHGAGRFYCFYLILGHPWMSQHSPLVSWNTGEILKWSDFCVKNCLSPVKKWPHQCSAQWQSSASNIISLNSTTIESLETANNQEYRASQDAFSKQLVAKLPPHQSWCLGQFYLRVRSVHCPSWNRRPWKSTLGRHSSNYSSNHLHLHIRVSFL